MKALKIFLGVVIVLAAAFGVAKAFVLKDGYSITHDGSWREVSHSEVSITIPKTMKLDKDRSVKKDNTEAVYYKNTKAEVRIGKTGYPDPEKLKKVDLEEIVTKNAEKQGNSAVKKINNGYYFTYVGKEKTQTHYSLLAFFIEGDAIYDVEVSCLLGDKDKFEDSMVKWLESFEISA